MKTFIYKQKMITSFINPDIYNHVYLKFLKPFNTINFIQQYILINKIVCTPEVINNMIQFIKKQINKIIKKFPVIKTTPYYDNEGYVQDFYMENVLEWIEENILVEISSVNVFAQGYFSVFIWDINTRDKPDPYLISGTLMDSLHADGFF
jgi:hypothetical protein